MSSHQFQVYAMIVLIILSPLSLLAQDNNHIINFTEGLVLKNPNYKGLVFSPDPIEHSIVLGTWKAPQEGDQVVFADTTALWQAIQIDSAGWFSDPSLRGGYIYISVVSEQDSIMLLEENGNEFVYVNGVPRIGNRYGYKDKWEIWEPKFNYTILPVQLKKGRNDFLFYLNRTNRLKAKLVMAESAVTINKKDLTLPDFLVGKSIKTWGSVLLSNNSQTSLKSYRIESQIENNTVQRTPIPIIQPLTVRKIGFELQGDAPKDTGEAIVSLKVINDQNEMVSSCTIPIRIKWPYEAHKQTFHSKIDGSVQYYAVNPAAQDHSDQSKALVLSVHGAAVEAINQANSYHPKSWAHIVSPTNRRPYGFNWEDWGRTDALEVLELAQTALNTDPNRIYLTGHSMGGHGTWHLGGLFPDQFAAIGPSAGWLSFWSYRVRADEENLSPIQKMLMRSTSPSKTMDLAENYKQFGIYILHGTADDNVSVDQSRQMVKHLEKFHRDFIYYEVPAQGHWWDLSDEPGSDCVDWAPLFDFFARHARPQKERIRQIEFITPNPGISAQNNWLTIEAQEEQLKFSKVNFRFDPGRRRIIGTTENVARMSFDLSILDGSDPLSFDLDGQKIDKVILNPETTKIWLEKRNQRWAVSSKPLNTQKGPHRYGTFKEAFNNRFLFVYGTQGDEKENAWACSKAKYDAEFFWYQGNGSIDIVADFDFNPELDKDRNVILYGNSNTNSTWKKLLATSPVQVSREKIRMGSRTIKGDNLGCLFIRPRPGSDIASVGVVAGTGLIGMKLTDQRPYLSPGYNYPDLVVFSPEMLQSREAGLRVTGFFGLDWSLETGDFEWNSDNE